MISSKIAGGVSKLFIPFFISLLNHNIFPGTPLYSDESEYDTRKFAFVVTKVLLPLALDYHIRSRANDVDAVAAAELSNLNGDQNAMSAAVQVRV